MKKAKNKVGQFCTNNLAIFVVGFVALLCAGFLFWGTRAEDGSVTLDGKPAVIEEYTEKFIEDANAAMYRIMNEDAPTDEETIKAADEDTGQGAMTTLETVLDRRLPDGDTDGGRGWQCSKYTAYLATGKREYSATHPDYGPRNGKDIAAWLVDNYGWKYIDTPVAGAIGSGGFNTKYGHTAMFLYFTGDNTAMVNDANYVPLTVSTHNMNISGWVWVVPDGDEPSPTPTPEPTPTPVASCKTIHVVYGDTMGAIMKRCKGYVIWGNAMNEYADKWISDRTQRSVFYGWTHGTGYGLIAGDTITFTGE